MRRVLGWLMMGLAVNACAPGSGSLNHTSRRAVVDTTLLSLGPTSLGMPVQGYVRMTNVGEGLVHAQLDVSPDGSPFMVLNRSINADSSGTDIPIRLPAFEAGTFEATLTLTTDGEEPRILTVALHAVVNGPPDCDDHNPCTLDLLQGNSCSHVNVGGACDDGQACTVADHCSEGACVGQPITCDDGVDCTVDACDEVLGCTYLPRQEACEDGNACTANTCVPGVGCTTALAPNGTLCGFPACDAMPLCIGGECVTNPAPDGFPCEDGDPCSTGDHCVGGTCRRGLGEPMGVGDPIVVTTSSFSAQGRLDPTQVLGLQPLPNDRLRVAWLAAPNCLDLPCADAGACAGGELPVPPSNAAVHVSVVDAAGNHLGETLLDPPETGAAALNARATLTDAGLLVLVNYQTVPGCGGPGVRISGPQLLTVVYRIDQDGAVHGPETLTQGLVDNSLGSPALLPLAAGSHRNTAALVHSVPRRQQCLGACPDAVELTVQLLKADVWPPQITEQATYAVSLTGPSSTLGAVDNLHVAITADQLVMAWRQQESASADTCGPVDDLVWRAYSWRAQPGHLDGGATHLEGDDGRARGVTVTAGSLGASLFVANAHVSPAPVCIPEDPGCTAMQCSVTESVTVSEGGETSTLFTQENQGGNGMLASLSSGSAFGRAVAVMLQTDGKVRLAAPALGPLPAVAAEYAPPANVPVQLVPGSDPLLVASGRDAWLGALLGARQLDPTLRGVAVIIAGCGKTGTGTVLGWPPPMPDAGVASEDAGVVAVDAGVSSADGGDAGVTLDDAGSAILTTAADGGVADAG